MTLRHDTCRTGAHENALDLARCDYEAALLESLTAHAATLGRPPTDAQLHDLWAHANTVYSDGAMAARWVRQVLDLGWRPTIGVAEAAVS